MIKQNSWRQYIGCFYPVVAIIGLMLVLFVLAKIIGVEKPRFPLRDLTPLPNYPENVSLSEAALITEIGLKWLMLTYFYWLVGIFSLGFCFIQLRNATMQCDGSLRRIIISIFGASVLITIGVLFYYTNVRGTPLMSFEFLLRNIQLVGQGLVDLTTYSTALAYIVITAVMVVISLLLIPDAYEDNEVKQIQAITRVMYCAAAFLLVWIAQATEMYRFSATLLIEEERKHTLKLASTISLMAGVFASLLLAATYMAAYSYLQARHRQERKQKIEKEVTGSLETEGKSPKHFLLAHWPKITAVLMPVLPGAIGSVLNVLAQPI